MILILIKKMKRNKYQKKEKIQKIKEKIFENEKNQRKKNDEKRKGE